MFLMHAKHMYCRDKGGKNLLPWTQPEEVSNAWKRLSKGRPCDYSAMTYEKLQKACSKPEIVISEEDAAFVRAKDGDEVLVQSRRGQVQLPVGVGDIENGQTFIRFHFGSFDAKGGKARQANQLILDEGSHSEFARVFYLLEVNTWDAVSKKPNFRSGAFEISKVSPAPPGEVGFHAREKQTWAEERASEKRHVELDKIPQRQRQQERWSGELVVVINRLVDIYPQLVPQLIHGSKIQAGLYYGFYYRPHARSPVPNCGTVPRRQKLGTAPGGRSCRHAVSARR